MGDVYLGAKYVDGIAVELMGDVYLGAKYVD